MLQIATMPTPAADPFILRWLDDLRRDALYAVRSFARTRVFTAAAVLTLSVGIGAITAIYSVVNAVLLRPLPYDNSSRLVRVVENFGAVFPGRPPLQRGVSYLNFLEWRTRTRTLTDPIAVIALGQRLVRTADGTARLWGIMTSASTFTVVGAQAALGRTLVEADDANPSAIVLSFDVWRRLFHADPHVVGTQIELRAPDQPGRLLTVVGIMPASFELPTGRADFYTPIALDAAAQRNASVTMIARLGSGIPLGVAIDEANVIGTAIRPPPRADAAPLTVRRFDVQLLKDRIVQDLRPALRLLLAAVGVVLLIVCANVANLLLARGTARQREWAVRVAIGAGRGRLARQILAECIVLAAAGGLLGGVWGAAGVALVKRLATVDAPGIFRLGFGATVLPRANEVGVDAKVFAIALAIAAVACLVFGLLPALQLSRINHLSALGSRGGADRGGASTRAALVVAQLVLATVLLVGAGLLIKSFVTLSTIDTGYDPSNVVAVQLVFPADYSTGRKVESIDALLGRLRATPTIEAAGFTRAGVLIGEELTIGTFVPRGRTLDEMRPVKARVRAVSAGFLTAMGIRLLGGREFSTADTVTAPPVIVMNRSAAKQFFGDTSPVGEVVEWNVAKDRIPVQVVGVVEEIRNETLAHDPVPEIFVEYRQLLTLAERWGDPPRRRDEMAIGFFSFAVRTRTDPRSVIPEIARMVRQVDANAGIDAIAPLAQLMASSVARPRFYAILLGVFAAVAAFLAAIGVYGVLAYTVAQRTQEIGIRMALGAQRSQVLGLILRKGVVLTVVGIAVGLAAAAAGTPLLRGMLFGVTPLDARTFAAVGIAFAAVAIVACYLPATRATRVDPMVALRSD